jgi:hypothetical protein
VLNDNPTQVHLEKEIAVPMIDMSRKKRQIPFVAVIAMLVLSASVTASASAAVQHWYSGSGESMKLLGNKPLEVTGAQKVPYHFGFSVSAVLLETQCENGTTGGFVQNPSGGAAGTLTSGSLKLYGCKVVSPKAYSECRLTSRSESGIKNGVGNIFFHPLQAVLGENKLGRVVTYSAASGEVALDLVLEPGYPVCPIEGENKQVKGYLRAVQGSQPGDFSFVKNSEAGSHLFFEGLNAWVTGEFHLTGGGQPISVAP